MKSVSRLLVIVLYAISPYQFFGQSTVDGALGVNLATVKDNSGQPYEDQVCLPGLQVGFGLTVPLCERWAFSPMFLCTQGGEANRNDQYRWGTRKKFLQLAAPVSFTHKINDKQSVTAKAGPVINYWERATSFNDFSGTTVKTKIDLAQNDAVHRFFASGIVGIYYNRQWPDFTVSVGLKADVGLTPIQSYEGFNGETIKSKTRSLALEGVFSYPIDNLLGKGKDRSEFEINLAPEEEGESTPYERTLASYHRARDLVDDASYSDDPKQSKEDLAQQALDELEQTKKLLKEGIKEWKKGDDGGTGPTTAETFTRFIEELETRAHTIIENNKPAVPDSTVTVTFTYTPEELYPSDYDITLLVDTTKLTYTDSVTVLLGDSSRVDYPWPGSHHNWDSTITGLPKTDSTIHMGSTPPPVIYGEEIEGSWIKVQGAMEPTQGVWQDDDYFDDKPTKQLTEKSVTDREAELDMVANRWTAVFGIQGARKEITMSGTSTYTENVPVKFQLRVKQGGGEKVIWTQSFAKSFIPISGGPGPEVPWRAVLPSLGEGAAPVPQTFKLKPGPYELVLELMMPSGQGTGLMLTTHGNVVVTSFPTVHIVPAVLSTNWTASTIRALRDDVTRLTAACQKKLPVLMPVPDNGITVVPHTIQDLTSQELGKLDYFISLLPGTNSQEDVRKDRMIAKLVQKFATGSQMTGGGKVVVVLDDDNFAVVNRRHDEIAGFAPHAKVVIVQKGEDECEHRPDQLVRQPRRHGRPDDPRRPQGEHRLVPVGHLDPLGLDDRLGDDHLPPRHRPQTDHRPRAGRRG